jgi:hypothetical protein
MPKKKYEKRSGWGSSPEYRAWFNARKRCTDPSHCRFYTHGGRGIEFRFPSFFEFLAEVGSRPSPQHSLERPNNDGHYEKGNVCWATRGEQQKNKRSYTHKVRHGKGYYFHKLSGKWMARIKYKNSTKYLGLFATEDKARAAYASAFQSILEIS